jgi:FlaA1/EpsC-like NDP-sugar epimerase
MKTYRGTDANRRHRAGRQTSTDLLIPMPSSPARRVLIAGCGSGGRYIARELREDQKLGLTPVGFVDDNAAKWGRTAERLPVFGPISDIPEIVTYRDIDVVIVAMPSATKDQHSSVTSIAQASTAEVIVMPSFETIVNGVKRSESLHRVSMTDVLGRPIVEPDVARCRAFIEGRRVIVTGAAGSIGKELSAQVARLNPANLILMDINESDIFDLEQLLLLENPKLHTTAVVGSVTDVLRLESIFSAMRPDIVFHAAAYKHVPLMETYPGEAVRTNAGGTRNVALAAAASGCERFVLVSTDKAVRPSSVMGATKRLAEIILADISTRTGLSSCSVRFGNVLGSRGSVIPTFERQILAGGPVTVTDRDMRRYFMTIPEAASLIIQSGAFGEHNAVCILDMGDDVSILELAERVIELHGYRPYIDIPITFTGIRQGEKLREDLSNDFEHATPSPHPKIRTMNGIGSAIVMEMLDDHLRRFEALDRQGKTAEIRLKLHDLIARIDARLENHGHHNLTPATYSAGAAGDR